MFAIGDAVITTKAYDGKGGNGARITHTDIVRGCDGEAVQIVKVAWIEGGTSVWNAATYFEADK